MQINPLGSHVGVQAPETRHFGFEEKKTEPRDFMKVLESTMREGIESTNADQLKSEQMNLQMAVAPETVNVHDVMIAEQQAQFSLDFTRTVIQKVVQAYQNITNLR